MFRRVTDVRRSQLLLAVPTLLLGLSPALPILAAPLGQPWKTFRDWTVFKNGATCTAALSANPDIQIGADANLYVGVANSQGGLRSYQYQFDYLSPVGPFTASNDQQASDTWSIGPDVWADRTLLRYQFTNDSGQTISGRYHIKGAQAAFDSLGSCAQQP